MATAPQLNVTTCTQTESSLGVSAVAGTLAAKAAEPAGLYGGSMARRRYQKGRVFLRGVKKRVWVGRWRDDIVQPDGSVQRVERSVILGPECEFTIGKNGREKKILVTQKMAQRCLDPILARINAPEYRPVRTATLDDFAERWRAEVLAHRKPATIKAANSHLRHHVAPYLGRRRLDEIGQEIQQSFVTDLAKRVSRKTVVNILGTLSSILRTAKRWGYICESVKFGELVLPAEPVKRAPAYFDAEQARQIIGVASQPYTSMFAIAGMTGLRAGELLGLLVDDLDFERRLIHVRQSVWCGKFQTVKSKASRAPVAMPEALALMLKTYLASWNPNPARLLFVNRAGRPYNATKVVQRGLWPVLDKLKINRCGLHAFRHTHTSLLLAVGAPMPAVQTQLRHSDPRITLAVYGHVIGDSQRNAVEKVAEILRPDALKSESTGEWIQ
jgi:integrase